MDEVLEREDKWDVDEQFVLPGLDRVVAGAIVSPTPSIWLAGLLRHSRG